jgi:hypothetical protein
MPACTLKVMVPSSFLVMSTEYPSIVRCNGAWLRFDITINFHFWCINEFYSPKAAMDAVLGALQSGNRLVEFAVETNRASILSDSRLISGSIFTAAALR